VTRRRRRPRRASPRYGRARRAAAALQVTEDRGAHFNIRELFNLGRDELSDARVPGARLRHLRSRVHPSRYHRASRGSRLRRRRRSRTPNRRPPASEVAHDVVHRYREFGNHDHVRTPASPPIAATQPSGVHRLDDHDAVMRRRRRVEPVDRFTHDADRGVKADAVVGAEQVVVEVLGTPTMAPRDRPATSKFGAYRRRQWRSTHRDAHRWRPAPVRDRPSGCRGCSAVPSSVPPGDDALEVAREEGRPAYSLASPAQPLAMPMTSCPSRRPFAMPGWPR